MMEGVLGVKNLTIIYDKDTPKQFIALKNISFFAKQSEFVIVFGPSGCGKSTLLYTLSGIERHIASGDVWVNNKNIAKMNEKGLLALHRHDVGMIFQAYNLVGTLNVMSNVTLPLLAIGVSEKARKKLAQDLFDRLGIAHLAKRYPGDLSGGQQQRVAIARSLITDPEIIFADEPTGNLDAVSTEVVLKQILELRSKYKKTILMVTHDPSFIRYADRVVYLKDGSLVKIDEKVGEKKFITQGMEETESLTSKIPVNYYGTSPFDAEYTIEFSPEESETFYAVKLFTDAYARKEAEVLKNRTYHIFFEVSIKKLPVKTALFVLQKPIVEGGLGYSLDSAIDLFFNLEQFFEIRKTLSITAPEKRLSAESLKHLSRWVLSTVSQKINSTQNKRFCKGVSEYFLGHMDDSSFSFFVKNSIERGGVGFIGIETEPFIKKLRLIEDLIPIKKEKTQEIKLV